MQTFMPFTNFGECAQVLDRQRLGKQRVEAWQIYQSLTDPDYGWKNHPAVRMWEGYEWALCAYGMAICEEWIDRGYVDNMRPRFQHEFNRFDWMDQGRIPYWYGGYIHETHRAMLHWKDPIHYADLYGTFDPEITDYYWPSRDTQWN